MRQWVLSAQHILSGTWAQSEEELTNAAGARQFDRWQRQLAESQGTEGYSDQEQQCLKHFLQITQN
jgi:hypothetical protein